MGEEKIIHTTGRCNCGGRCILHAHVRDGKVVRMTTDTPAAAGDCVPLYACARGLHSHETFLGPDRLRQPLLRVGERGEGKFVPISWPEAVDRIACEWVRIRDKYGPGSRYVNYATGVSAAVEPQQLAKRLLSLDGGYLGRYNSYSTACIAQATELMYGTGESGNSPENWLNSHLILLWGHNPAETRFDSVSMHYLRRAREKGIPMIVIDPRRSDTVDALGAEWVPIRPATDAALLDAMAYVIWSEGLHDQAFLDRCCLGSDKVHMPAGADPRDCVLSYLTGEADGVVKTPEWAQEITGVPACTIRSLARRYANAKPAVLMQGYGPQRHAYGEQSARGAILLACMTGNVGVSGGWAGGVGRCHRHQEPKLPKVENPYPLAIPAYCWTQAVERGHEMTALDGVRGGERLESDIKMILNLAGNCLVNQHGDINRTAALLRDPSKCEFILCSDLFMTSSAKFADILLPGVSYLECENITTPWMWGDFVGFNNKAVEPLYEGRFEYDWLSEVAEKLGLKEQFTEGRTMGEWLEFIYNATRRAEPQLPEFETFKRAGIYRYRDRAPKIAFRENCADPEKHPFPTESGKIELYSPKVARTEYKAYFPPIPRYVAPPEGPQDPKRAEYPLQLIGWHTKRRCHSIHDQNPALERLDPQRLWLNPADAAERGLTDGMLAEVWNDRGRLRIPVKVTERICAGTAALAQGAWYAPDGSGTDLGGSINVLTTLEDTPYAHGNPQHTNLVQVRRVNETAE